MMESVFKYPRCSNWALLFSKYFIFIVLSSVGVVNAETLVNYGISKHAYQHKEVLGPNANYNLEWSVDWDTKTVTFNVSARCKGYIGLGLSKTGSIKGSDFVIGGIDSNGKPYFSDMHGLKNGSLAQDARQDWKLLSARKSKEEGKVHLSFSRSFETCDEQDLPISENLVHLIWAYGDTDEVTLFTPHYGKFPVYLLDPDLNDEIALSVYQQVGPHSNVILMQRWRALTRQRISSRTNSRSCTILKGLRLGYRHYILGGGAYVPHEAEQHVHQIILTKCVPPNGTDSVAFFQPLVKEEGEQCYSDGTPNLPKQHCTQKVYVWGLGGKAFYFPEDVGVVIGDSPDEYFMLEVTYHNPANLEDLEMKAGLDLMIQPAYRQHEAGIMTVNYGLQGHFTIPPRSTNLSIIGHCSSDCTRYIIEANESLTVFAGMLQMSSSGKSIRLRHFRDKAELPWIVRDDNYDHKFQPVRMFRKPVSILPGDQLTIQCMHDASFNGTALSGFSSGEEECAVQLFVNQPVATPWCSSEYPADNKLSGFDVDVSSRNKIIHKRAAPSASDPEAYVGDLLSEMTNKSFRWSSNVREPVKNEMKHAKQISFCPTQEALLTRSKDGKDYASKLHRSMDASASFVTIPSILSEYKPVSECKDTSIPQDFGYRNVLRSRIRTRAFPTVKTSTSTTPISTISTEVSSFSTKRPVRYSKFNFSRGNLSSIANENIRALFPRLKTLT